MCLVLIKDQLNFIVENKLISPYFKKQIQNIHKKMIFFLMSTNLEKSKKRQKYKKETQKTTITTQIEAVLGIRNSPPWFRIHGVGLAEILPQTSSPKGTF